MASRRKQYAPRGKAPTNAHVYAEFISDLLDGTVRAEKLIENRDRKGRISLEYDDPNG